MMGAMREERREAMIHIPFNKPFLTGKETQYIEEAVRSGKISGNGVFTQRCQRFLEERYGFGKVLLTTSCTDALEMAAILAGIRPGDEVIVPTYTFVSSALAFVRQGAKIVFADSCAGHPDIDLAQVESLVTPRTKALVVVHYAGMACDMEAALRLADKHHLVLVEDAAQAIDSHWRGRPLGGIGHIGCFSFHETKNIISGEGGALAIRDEAMRRRAEIIWEKGTNRAEFFRGEVNKYGWVDTGSSFLPSEIVSAFLWAQLEHLDEIQAKRKALWARYFAGLRDVAAEGFLELPAMPGGAENNAHMFYVVCRSLEERTDLIAALKAAGINAVFHYLPLHDSPFWRAVEPPRPLPNAQRFADCLLRLPLFYELQEDDVARICDTIRQFYGVRR